MQNNTLITLIVTIIVAGGGGYFLGKGGGVDTDKAKALDASITMMNEQAMSIQRMGEIMGSNGRMMQEFGTTYKDDKLISAGKDLEVVGMDYAKKSMGASDADNEMGHMMGN